MKFAAAALLFLSPATVAAFEWSTEDVSQMNAPRLFNVDLATPKSGHTMDGASSLLKDFVGRYSGHADYCNVVSDSNLEISEQGVSFYESYCEIDPNAEGPGPWQFTCSALDSEWQISMSLSKDAAGNLTLQIDDFEPGSYAACD